MEKPPEKFGSFDSDSGKEPRYTHGEYRVEIPIDVAKEDIAWTHPKLEALKR